MRRRCTLSLLMIFALPLLCPAVPVGAQTKEKADAKKPGAARRAGRGAAVAGQRAVKQVEAVWGKPLTAAQKKAVIAAAQERDKAMKPIRDRYRAGVAKALGITPEQLAAKERAQRAAQAKRSGTARR